MNTCASGKEHAASMASSSHAEFEGNKLAARSVLEQAALELDDVLEDIAIEGFEQEHLVGH